MYFSAFINKFEFFQCTLENSMAEISIYKYVRALNGAGIKGKIMMILVNLETYFKRMSSTYDNNINLCKKYIAIFNISCKELYDIYSEYGGSCLENHPIDSLEQYFNFINYIYIDHCQFILKNIEKSLEYIRTILLDYGTCIYQ